MNKSLSSLDWSLVRAFLAVAETGSLSAAARQLAQSQPTLGRQIKLLEDHLGLALFERRPRGLALTETGASLLEPAQAMRAAFGQLELAAAGQDAALRGTVRITASQVVAHYVLPPIIANIRRQEPDIQIELVPTDASENLLYREADIAVRMYRSQQLDVVTKHVADAHLGVFAAHSYLERRGAPETPQDLMQHDLVGYDRDDRIIQAMRAQGWPAGRDWFAVRCDDQTTYLQLLRHGCGIGFSQLSISGRDPLMAQVLPTLGLEPLEVWLAAPEAMRRTPRIRRVWDLLEVGLKAHFG